MKESLRLLNEIIEMEKVRDEGLKQIFIKSNRASMSVGESQILFHLKSLRELIEKESNQETKSVSSCVCSSQEFESNTADSIEYKYHCDGK